MSREHAVVYQVEYEHEGDNWSAYVPDLPGCIATGHSMEAVRRLISEAIEFHIEGLLEEGLPVPVPGPIRIGVVPPQVQIIHPRIPARTVVEMRRSFGVESPEGRCTCSSSSGLSATTLCTTA